MATLTLQPGPTAGKDAFVNQDANGTNYGNQTYLSHRGSSPENRSFLQFDLSAIPASATIKTAVLHLYLESIFSSTSLSLQAAPVSASWDEATIAWFNQPGVRTSDLSPIVAVTDATGSWFTWDVTAMAQSWHAGAYTNNGLRIAPTETGSQTRRFSSSDSSTATQRPKLVVTYTENTAPNAPTGLSPDGTTINRANTNRFSWTFSDPDAGDSQSKYDLRYRLTGASTWTTVSATTPNRFRDFPGGTFAAGDYEWQVRTYDAEGLVGPYSSSAFFTAADAPAGPTITDPVAGQTISTETYTVEWSTPSQESYQVRTVADDGFGAPDTTTVYTDTGEVVVPSARSRTVSFDTTGRDEHVQVRVRDAGLWSDWVSVNVTVSYTPPATPTVAVDDTVFEGAITVQPSHPEPSGSEPTVTSVDIWRRQTDDTGDGIRIAAAQPSTVVYVDWAVASGVGYAYRVRAIGDNGTSSWSAWSEEPSDIDIYYGGAYPS